MTCVRHSGTGVWLSRAAGPLLLAVVLGAILPGRPIEAQAGETAGLRHSAHELAFGVFWPPQAPLPDQTQAAKPLLQGALRVAWEELPARACLARLTVTLTRPSDEAARESWNSKLAFAEIDWMRYVRVWDGEGRWLWPNLPYLLRLPGVERVERYGGVDPGKGVDNDFAALLIRNYDATGQTEDARTRKRPLVSAEWRAAGATNVNKQTVVHSARSDEFTFHLGGGPVLGKSLARVWLVYADFMGARTPPGWPDAPEFAGGVLAYFEIEWDPEAAQERRLTMRQTIPRQGTGFDWARWVSRTKLATNWTATARLADAP